MLTSWVLDDSLSCMLLLGMDNINLRLLTTARHHQELEEFNPHHQLEETEDSAARGDKRPASLSPQREKKKRH